MSENTQAHELDVPNVQLIHPTSGEVVSLPDATGDELDRIDTDLARLIVTVGMMRQLVAAEVARRADRLNARTVELDGTTWEVNAPTEDVYTVEAIRRELEPMVKAGRIDQAILDSLIVKPPPKPQDPRVDKRKVNTLLRTNDGAVLAALAAARQTRNTTRTAKVTRRALDTTAEELDA